MNPWIETYRGTVHRWEVDNVDHFTVAFYFDRLADASMNALDAFGLGPTGLTRAGARWVTVDCYVRYLHELRMGDILHVLSGVIAVEPAGLVMGHQLFDSARDTLCATIEQRVRLQRARAPIKLTARQRQDLEARRVVWNGPPREHRPAPRGEAGFHDTSRDVVMPWEIDVTGQSALSHYIHRFSAANAQLIARFGMTPAYMSAQHRGFSTFEFQLALVGKLRAGDPVAVRSGLVHLGNSSMRVLHRMVNPRSGALVATLHQLGVHLDLDGRRPTPLPDELREQAKALLIS
jgi:acyl-CoA thioester hydrolase